MKINLFVFSLLCWMICGKVFAQRLKLTDITKISLTEGAHDHYFGRYRVIEAKPENGVWKSYQIQYYTVYDLKTKGETDDTTHHYIKSIPIVTLNLLLSIVAEHDTSVHESYFNLDTDELIRYIDTIRPQINEHQRQRFIDSIHSKAVVYNVLVKNVKSKIRFDERTPYSITIFTKQGEKISIYGENREELYLFPWVINRQEYFDPRITDIYNSITNNAEMSKILRDNLHRVVDREIYWKYFETEFGWDDFKTKHPSAYASYGGTITPARLTRGNTVDAGTSLSSRLPSYLLIKFWLEGDTTVVYKFKSYEDTLVKIFKRHNFLFDYFEHQRDAHIYAYVGRTIGRVGLAYFKEIKRYYPGITKFQPHQALIIYCHNKSNRKVSRWMILPDNKILLLGYTGTMSLDSNGKFKEITPDGIIDTYSLQHSVCIAFDSKGRKIAGNTDHVDIGEY